MQPPTSGAPKAGAAVRRDVALVGASAGGVEALTTLVRGLPADVPLAFIVVLHLPSTADSKLAEILSRAGPLPTVVASHGDAIEPGRIFVAPPDYHLVISNDRMFLLDGARENGFRPAIDPLFRSAARALGPRANGIILSGTMDDGAAGLAAIQAFGGATIVQEPSDALAGGMPEAALDALEPDHVLPATAMGRLLDELANAEVEVDQAAHRARLSVLHTSDAEQPGSGDLTLVADPMELEPEGVDLSCPECGGALQEIQAGRMSRFRCRTGHVYSPLTLLETKGTELEAALWAALRALEEEASVAGRLAVRSRDAGADSAARRFAIRQGDAAQRADLVRHAIHAIGRSSGEAEEAATSDQPRVVRS